MAATSARMMVAFGSKRLPDLPLIAVDSRRYGDEDEPEDEGGPDGGRTYEILHGPPRGVGNDAASPRPA